MTSFLNEACDSSETTGGRRITILVVDDHPVVRYGICNLVGAQPDFHVVGEAEDESTALQLMEEKCPDVLLLDLELGTQESSSGLIARVIQENPHSRVVIYTAHDSENRVMEAIRSGASAYVVKSSRIELLYDAIRVVTGGGSYLDPCIASLVMGRVGRRHERRAANSRDLTSREQQVLRGLASGMRNQEIAESLFISEHTVKYHIKSMFSKMQAKSRTEVVKIAIDNGIL